MGRDIIGKIRSVTKSLIPLFIPLTALLYRQKSCASAAENVFKRKKASLLSKMNSQGLHLFYRLTDVDVLPLLLSDSKQTTSRVSCY